MDSSKPGTSSKKKGTPKPFADRPRRAEVSKPKRSLKFEMPKVQKTAVIEIVDLSDDEEKEVKKIEEKLLKVDLDSTTSDLEPEKTKNYGARLNFTNVFRPGEFENVDPKNVTLTPEQLFALMVLKPGAGGQVKTRPMSFVLTLPKAKVTTSQPDDSTKSAGADMEVENVPEIKPLEAEPEQESKSMEKYLPVPDAVREIVVESEPASGGESESESEDVAVEFNLLGLEGGNLEGQQIQIALPVEDQALEQEKQAQTKITLGNSESEIGKMEDSTESMEIQVQPGTSSVPDPTPVEPLEPPIIEFYVEQQQSDDLAEGAEVCMEVEKEMDGVFAGEALLVGTIEVEIDALPQEPSPPQEDTLGSNSVSREADSISKTLKPEPLQFDECTPPTPAPSTFKPDLSSLLDSAPSSASIPSVSGEQGSAPQFPQSSTSSSLKGKKRKLEPEDCLANKRSLHD